MLGIEACAFSTVVASILGKHAGGFVPDRLQKEMMHVLTVLCFLTAYSSIRNMESLIPVACALVLGGTAGSLAGLADYIPERVLFLISRCPGTGKTGASVDSDDVRRRFSSLICILCFSGAGITGSLSAGTTGDASLLFVKAMMDFPVVLIFSSHLGIGTAFLAILEVMIYGTLYFSAAALSPFLQGSAAGSLSCCGGAIILCAAFNMAGLCDLKGLNLLPALVLSVPLTTLLR